MVAKTPDRIEKHILLRAPRSRVWRALTTPAEISVIESGFEHIPAARRAQALRMNDGGWAIQLQNIARHVAS